MSLATVTHADHWLQQNLSANHSGIDAYLIITKPSNLH